MAAGMGRPSRSMTSRKRKTKATAVATMTAPNLGWMESPPGISTVRRPTMIAVSAKITKAVSADSLMAVAKSKVRRDATEPSMTAIRLDLLDVGSSEQPGRPEDQDEHEHRECRDILVLDGKVPRPERLDEADQEAAEHGAGYRADAAENGGGERLDAGKKADIEVDYPVLEQEDQAGNGGQCCADDEGQGDRAVDIDAEEGGHAAVLL